MEIGVVNETRHGFFKARVLVTAESELTAQATHRKPYKEWY
jgi:hypothetical protein